MKIRPVFMLAISVLVTLGAYAQGSLSVTHEAPSCLSSLCGRTTLIATVTGPSAPTSVRVYFRAGSEGPEYYLEMMSAGDGLYVAVLPAALRDTASVSYRIVAVAEDGSTTSTDPVALPVTSDCQLATLTENELGFATNTIVGLTETSQTGAPTGFSCAGLTKVVGVDQTMGPNSACEEVRLAKSDPCFGAEGETLIANAAQVAAEPGRRGLTAAVIAAGAVIGGAIIIENNNDEPREPVSRSRP
jgi:hypothetical protein